MKAYIEQAKVMPKGQITIPAEIRKLLGLSVGDRVSFIVSDDKVMICNSAIAALKLIQDGMKGEADKLGLKDEEDVQRLLEQD